MSKAEYVHTHYVDMRRLDRVVHAPSGRTLGTIQRGVYEDGAPAWLADDTNGESIGAFDTFYRAVECVSEGPTGTGTKYA